MEIWKTVKGYNKYEVSNLGNVRSVDRVVIMKNNNKRLFYGKLLKLVVNSKGYSVVSIYNNKNERNVVRVHRLVADAFLKGKTDLRNQINHKDGNKRNNSEFNLEWCSQSDNNLHGRDNGLIVALKGENQPLASLNRLQVLEIREHLKEKKLLQKQIAQLYGVSEWCISKIKRGVTYVSEL